MLKYIDSTQGSYIQTSHQLQLACQFCQRAGFNLVWPMVSRRYVLIFRSEEKDLSDVHVVAGVVTQRRVIAAGQYKAA